MKNRVPRWFLKNLLMIHVLTVLIVLSGCIVSDEDFVKDDSQNLGDEIANETDEETVIVADSDYQKDEEGIDDNDQNNSNDAEQTYSDDVICTPDEEVECYQGPAGTKNSGICRAGVKTCSKSGRSWSPCVGEQLPQREICGNLIDEDCDGLDNTVENIKDYDGDGYNYCNGDCCEHETECAFPATVHPGAYEFHDNKIDDNCNGVVDEVESCDAGLSKNSISGADAAAAIDICAMTDKKDYGLISASFSYPNGKKTSDPFEIKGLSGETINCPSKGIPVEQHAILNNFGSVIKPHMGESFLLMSTGIADNPIPNILAGKYGITTEFLCSRSTAPEDWYAANGNKFPQAASCKDAKSGENPVNDPIMLEIIAKAPPTASAFEVDIYFFSREFPKYICSAKGYNDFFVILLDSKFKTSDPSIENPHDKNLAMDKNKNPVGVNLVNDGLFRVCCNEGSDACKYTKLNTPDYSDLCTMGPDELDGTGLYLPESKFDDMHGATGWLTSRGNILPGEEITLRFAIWDTGDHIFDSQVIIDNFRWLPAPTNPGTFEQR